MSTYLRNLVARTIGAANVVRPNLGPRFPVGGGEADESSALTPTSERNVVRPSHAPRFLAGRLEADEPCALTSTSERERSALAVGLNEPYASAVARDAPERETNKRVGPVLEMGDRSVVQTSPSGASPTSPSGASPTSPSGASPTSPIGASPTSPSALVTRLDSADRKRSPLDATTSEDICENAAAKPAIANEYSHKKGSPRLPVDAAAVEPVHIAERVESEPQRTQGRVDARSSPSHRARVDELEIAPHAGEGEPVTAAQVEGVRAEARATRADAPEPQFGLALARQLASRHRGQEPARQRRAERELEAPEPAFARGDTVVNVTIGRIEVRAPDAPQPKLPLKDTRTAPSPSSELDAYLRGRNEARR